MSRDLARHRIWVITHVLLGMTVHYQRVLMYTVFAVANALHPFNILPPNGPKAWAMELDCFAATGYGGFGLSALSIWWIVGPLLKTKSKSDSQSSAKNSKGNWDRSSNLLSVLRIFYVPSERRFILCWFGKIPGWDWWIPARLDIYFHMSTHALASTFVKDQYIPLFPTNCMHSYLCVGGKMQNARLTNRAHLRHAFAPVYEPFIWKERLLLSKYLPFWSHPITPVSLKSQKRFLHQEFYQTNQNWLLQLSIIRHKCPASIEMYLLRILQTKATISKSISA